MIDKKNFYILFFLSILFFLTKWIYSYLINFDLDIFTRILFNVDDRHYLPLVYSFSKFDLNPVYNNYDESFLFLPFPIYSIGIHSIFFKIFGISSFLITEWLFIFLFLFLNFKIFDLIGLEKIENFTLIIILVCLPSLIFFLNLNNLSIYFNSLLHYHSTNFPRPLVSSIYLLLFLYLSIRLIKSYSPVLIIFIGIVFSLLFGSVYYHLPICGLLFLIIYFKKFFLENRMKLEFHFKNLFFISIGLILMIPQIFIVIKAEPLYTSVAGLTDINFENKKIILNSVLTKLSSSKFIIFFTINSILFFLVKKINTNVNNGLEVFYYFFISSIFGFLIFVIISPKISEIYHFNNLILYSGLLNFFIYVYIFFFNILRKFKYKNIFVISLILISLISINSFYYKQSKIRDTSEVFNFQKTINFIKKKNINSNTKVLTFDENLQIYFILNDFSQILLTTTFFNSKNLNLMEKELFFYLKFIGVSEDKFLNLIKNEKASWRYFNSFLSQFYYLKYQKSQINKHLFDKEDFSNEEWVHLINTSPSSPQNIFLSINEKNILLNKFIKYQKEFALPELIIKNKNSYLKNHMNMKNNYCYYEKYEHVFYLSNSSKCD
ncbi:hypothetical protein [Candidatus Pelagibacter sp.]|uniref:hypothetical protein n=1 Tax=Candidatus Pelagibacter sp. TaxID=2024849 RepID=UPI003F8511E5